jgi:Uma2 family endonuclease
MKATGNVRLPNVTFVCKGRLPTVRTPVPTLAPDLAVEVLSAGNTAGEMARKREEYFRSGTRLVWMVDPDTRTVAIYHAPEGPDRVVDESGTLDAEDVVAGFSTPVA